MMKKLLVLSLVLCLASLANAGLSVVGGEGIVLHPSDTIVLQVVGDGEFATNMGLFLTVEDAGRINGGQVVWALPGSASLSSYLDKEALDAQFGADSVEMFNGFLGKTTITDVASATLASPAAPTPALLGVIVDGIIFHCDGGPGDVIITLYDGTFAQLDQIIIHQVPEPASLALLGLGGLFLRRRK